MEAACEGDGCPRQAEARRTPGLSGPADVALNDHFGAVADRSELSTEVFDWMEVFYNRTRSSQPSGTTVVI